MWFVYPPHVIVKMAQLQVFFLYSSVKATVLNSIIFQVNYFESEMQRLNGEQLVLIQENLHTLFAQCIDTLGHEHNIRVVYALQVGWAVRCYQYCM